ncbi:MAG: wax ester/triacylglycerol synthase family O-acyltransferase [Acidimicrobiales bacterium]|nr:wax ester/triacylglycerol synthase family O-acyltransferase [Acidimicrobiales bacterium]
MLRLTGLDATFLYMETPSAHMHVASTAVFDPSDVPGGYSFDKVKEMVANRLPLLPPFRRRLVMVPFQLHHPLWIEDPDFDIDYHVRRAALPAPGGEAELAELAGDIMARPLHRSRPLWEMYVIEGLEGGYIATVTKTHHAAIDGVSGAELTANLLDLSAETMWLDPAEDTWTPDRIPSDAELVGYAAQSLARQPLAAAKAVRRTAEAALNVRRRNREPNTNPPPAPFSAPNTSINTAITPHRKFAFTQMSLDDVKHVKNTLGGTVNDIVLALCAGALRRYFDAKDEQLDGALVGMIPISVRAEDEAGAMGNRVSSMLVSLASDVDDPLDRIATIRSATQNAKEQDKAIGADTLTNWAEFAAPAVAARAARLYSNMKIADRHRPLFNVTISNVPGPPFPLYSAGARMVALYPMGPIMDGGALNMTVMSYMDTMNFGLVACAETIPNVGDIARYLDEALEELLKLANEKTQPAAKPAAKAAAKSTAKSTGAKKAK